MIVSLIKTTLFPLAVLLVFLIPRQAQSIGLSDLGNLEQELREDIADGRLDRFSLIEAAFVLSGVTERDSLQRYVAWYDNLVQGLENYHFDPFDRPGSAAKVFSYLHTTWLITYKERATTLVEVVQEKRFNCVAGTILYNLVCQDLGWYTEAFETPSHTYTIFPHFTERIMVENTSPMGFDIMKNLQDYSRYLLQFYPQQQALQIGLDRLYAYENTKGRAINNQELLGLLAYNRAYFARERQDYAKAFEYVQLAQLFNQDSRSNIHFEVGLYYRWGKQLFDAGRFTDAFQVYRAGYERHWQVSDFAANTKVAFLNALRQLWNERRWQESHNLLDQMSRTELLQSDDFLLIRPILQNWAELFLQTGNSAQAAELFTDWAILAPNDPMLKAYQ